MTRWSSPSPELFRKLRLHQRWLTSQGREGKRFKAVCLDLDGVDLDGCDLSICEITGDYIRNCSLRGAWFIGAVINFVSFEGSDLTYARFDSADLYEANFLNAKYVGANFTSAYIEKAIWTKHDAKAAQEELAVRLKDFSKVSATWTTTDRREHSRQAKEATSQRIAAALAFWQSTRCKVLPAPNP